jgi:rubredoxin
MNDFWNNPPEDAEVNCPKCGEPADFVRKTEDGDNYSCTACGHEFREVVEPVTPFDGPTPCEFSAKEE